MRGRHAAPGDRRRQRLEPGTTTFEPNRREAGSDGVGETLGEAVTAGRGVAAGVGVGVGVGVGLGIGVGVGAAAGAGISAGCVAEAGLGPGVAVGASVAADPGVPAGVTVVSVNRAGGAVAASAATAGAALRSQRSVAGYGDPPRAGRTRAISRYVDGPMVAGGSAA